VAHLFDTVVTAIGAFAATNIDDFVLLTILFTASQTGGLRGGSIIIGQYLGFSVLLVISGAAAAGLVTVPNRWVGLLGLLPLAASLRGFLKAFRHGNDDGEQPVVANSLLSVAAVTVANGGDNLAVYILMFHKQAPEDTAITVVLFLLLLAVWCVGAILIGTYAQVVSVLTRIGQWLVPTVYLIIGVVVLIRSGLLTRLTALA
jgi:cadmium resistance protein CadD (predicted permease)